MKNYGLTLLSITALFGAPVAASADEAHLAPIIGAWASGDTAEACDTAPITHFMSDGIVAVFLKKDGVLHSIGSWSANATEMTMTHNDFPLSGDGISKSPVTLDIIQLDDTRFVTRNAKGEERARVRCADIEITMGHDHEAH